MTGPQEAEPAPAGAKTAAFRLRLRPRESLAAEILQLRAALEQAQAALEQRDAVIRALLSSRSWRLSAPLRALTRRLRAEAEPAAPPPLPPLLPPPAPAPAAATGAPGAAALTPLPVTPAQAAAHRRVLGLDLAPPAIGVGLVAPGGGSARLHASLAAARLPGWARVFPAPEAAFAAGADLAMAVPEGAALDTQCLWRLAQAHLAAEGRAVLEATAFPDENPRPFDPDRFDIPWLSPHGWAMPRAAWEAAGWAGPEAAAGLGRRAAAAGFALRLVPHALLLAPPPAGGSAAGARWR
ncbi:hypothetical protein ACI6QG_13340 [Roseococcus sp. DSY-14]|uniref:hypothetical protein n=1 Tax=Roseococcus sp. DSY-14 TaxID=3369650 RepID=UPI00387ACDEF